MPKTIVDIRYEARIGDGASTPVPRRAIYMSETQRRSAIEMYLTQEYVDGEYAFCAISSVSVSPPSATINPATWPVGWSSDNILLGGEMELGDDALPYFSHGDKFRIIQQIGNVLYLDKYPQGCVGKWVMLRDFNTVAAREMVKDVISFLKPTHKLIYYLVPKLPTSAEADFCRPYLENYKLYSVL